MRYYLYDSRYLQLQMTLAIDLDGFINSVNFGKFNCKYENQGNEFSKKAFLQLDEYFNGERKKFDLLYKIGSKSDFDKAVLKEVTKIKYGSVITYKTLAQNIAYPKAYRAVANSLSKNDLPILIPCHRVIRSDMTVGGYYGSHEKGQSIKKRLLDLEDADQNCEKRFKENLNRI